jgi:ParB/Sulfiredoxin domain
MTATPTITINQEYAKLVPPMSAEEYESLKQSIKQSGFWPSHPIVINIQGVLLEGHHRYKACKELGIEPKTETMDFPDKQYEKMFVIDSNLQRRHLNNFQRIELALKSKSILEQIAKQNESLGGKMKGDRNLTPLGRVDEQIGRRAGVSRDTVRKVDIIVHKAPERVLQGLRTGGISINQDFEEYGRGNKQFAEIEHSLSRCLSDKEIPLFAELFEVGRMANKTDKEIEDEIRKMQDEFDKDILNDESMKNGTESYRECIKGIVCGLKGVREDSIKAAKNLADKNALVMKEFEKFAKLEKEGADLIAEYGQVKKYRFGFRHDRWIMAIEESRSYEDIKEQGLVHTFKDKRNLLFDAYVTTEDRMYVRVFDAKDVTKLPDLKDHALGRICAYQTDEGEYMQLDDAEPNHKTDHYRNLGRYILESEDAQTDRILGVKDKPDDPRILDYQVLYESPKCIEHKEQYSSGEWLIEKKTPPGVSAS